MSDFKPIIHSFGRKKLSKNILREQNNNLAVADKKQSLTAEDVGIEI